MGLGTPEEAPRWANTRAVEGSLLVPMRPDPEASSEAQAPAIAGDLDEGRIVHLGRLDDLRSCPDLPFARMVLEAIG